MTKPGFLLCDFFNEKGKRVERLYIVDEPGNAAADRVCETVRSVRLEPLLDALMAEAIRSGATTSLSDAALAINAMLNEVADERLPLCEAREIVSIRVNFLKAVTIVEAMPALEAEFGANAATWARRTFRGLDLGPDCIH